jgi:hypothetical protein
MVPQETIEQMGQPVRGCQLLAGLFPDGRAERPRMVALVKLEERELLIDRQCVHDPDDVVGLQLLEQGSERRVAQQGFPLLRGWLPWSP